LLKIALGIDIVAYAVAIGKIKSRNINFASALKHRYENETRCPDTEAADKMREAILAAKRRGDSIGGIVECVTNRLPVGLGEPLFSSLESDISRALFGIPSVKAVEFGSGFHGSTIPGSENNDAYILENGSVVTRTNNSGGILGGLSTGMPLVIRVGFKPPSSIAQTQETLDLSTRVQTKLNVPGRHDPCVVPRAPPVVEAMVSLVLADHAMRHGLISSSHMGVKSNT
jgi:chorismate synthase